MKKKSTLFLTIILGVASLFGCSKNSKDIQWSKWFDNGDGTHSRHDLNDITHEETEAHVHQLVRYIVEPTDVTPGEAIYQCEKCGAKEEKKVPPTGNYVFDQKVVDEKYLCERYSEHSASYYMSSKEGAFGNPDCVFEVSSLPDSYTEVNYVQGDGKQWVDTGVKNDRHHSISVNGAGGNNKIPEDYQQVEYIESTGTQYINTDIILNSKNIILADFLPTNYTHTGGVWCGRKDYDHNSMTLFILGGGYRYDYNSIHLDNKPIDLTQRQKVEARGNELYLNNTLIITHEEAEFNSGGPVKLFASYSGNGDINSTVGNFAHMKLYSFVIKNSSGTELHNMVPCYKKDGHVGGLYDIVNNKFYGNNAGNEDFIIGDEIHYNTDSQRVPVDFQEVEYIETTGCQQIKTGVFGPAIWSFDIEYSQEHIMERQLMGHGGSGGEYWGITDGQWRLATWYGVDKEVVGRNKYVVENLESGMSHYVNDEYLYTTGYDPRSEESECTLFAIGNAYYNYCKLYSCQVYDADKTTLLRDFVPCYKRIDGQGGLFDLVSSTFYEYIGEENLLFGDDVFIQEEGKLPIQYDELEYIDSHGDEFINTGYQISSEKIRIDFKVSFINDIHGLSLFGSASDEGQDDFVPYHHDGYGEYRFRHWVGTDGGVMEVEYSQTTEGSYLVDNGTINAVINGQDYSSTYNGTIQTGKDFYIFGLNPRTTASSERSHGYRLYSFKLYDNDVLVRDFVPAKDTDTGTVGLYDLAGKEFYTNGGSGELAPGPTIDMKDNSKDIKVEKITGIPEYYYQLNFIESTSLQEIDTGIKGNALIDLNIKFNVNGANQFMGYGEGQGEFFGISKDGTYLGSDIAAGNVDNFVIDYGNTIDNKGKIKINEYESDLFDISDVSENSLKLLSAGASNKCSTLFYRGKIYKGETLVRDFVPVLQKYTGIPGLFDLIEGRFYTSNTKYDLVAGGIVSDELNSENINIFCNTGANKSHPFKSKISTYQIFEDHKLKNDYVACIRNSDGVAGLYDLKNNVFVSSSSEFPLTYGKIIGHKLDEGKVIKSPTYSEEGEMVYKCIYTGQEVHQKVERTAYKITFVPENNQLTGVKIFNNNNPNDYTLSLIGYSRNINTYNYSKSGAYIYFEIPDDEKEYDIITFGGKVENLGKRQYRITEIRSDLFVQIRQI